VIKGCGGVSALSTLRLQYADAMQHIAFALFSMLQDGRPTEACVASASWHHQRLVGDAAAPINQSSDRPTL